LHGACLTLVDPVLVRRYPREVLSEPAAESVALCWRQEVFIFEHGDGASHLDEVHGIDDARASAREAAHDGL
jgi:hypothetical protein